MPGASSNPKHRCFPETFVCDFLTQPMSIHVCETCGRYWTVMRNEKGVATQIERATYYMSQILAEIVHASIVRENVRGR